MLKPPGGGAAEGEGESSHQRARRMPSPILEVDDQREARQHEHGEDRAIHRAEGRGGVEEGHQEKGRRKDLGLGIGDLRKTGENIGSPEGAVARRQRPGQKHDLRIGLRLGVPRNRDGARQPWPGEDESPRNKREAGEGVEPSSRPGLLALERHGPDFRWVLS